ncbi:MAG: LysM peptidoglycan-binding domain-containing protein, partial [Chloroflexota bacterium]
ALAVGGPSPSTTDAAAPFSAATVTPSSVGAASATPGELVHVVQSGDMLGSLAVKYDVTSEAIAKANGIALTTMLQVGQRLIIPGISAQPTATATPPPTSTPTVTPTLSPTLPPRDEGAQLKYLTPLLLAPVSGGVIEDTAQAALLNWASVGILAEREWYELSLWAPGEEGARQFYTKATSQRLDPAQRAADAPASAYAWQVRVVYRDATTGRVVALSPPSERYGFTWQ